MQKIQIGIDFDNVVEKIRIEWNVFLFEHQKLELVRKKTGRAAIKILTREMPSTRMAGVADASGTLPSNSGLVGYWLFHLQQN